MAEPGLLNKIVDYCIKKNIKLIGVKKIFTGGGAIFVSSNGTLAGQFYINGAYQQIDSGITSVNGTKYTVVLTYDGSTEKLYVNGELKGSINVSGVIAKTRKATSMALGGNPLRDGVDSGAFKGQILSAKIYNRGITADEVSQNYEAINDDDIVYEGLVKNIALKWKGKVKQWRITKN